MPIESELYLTRDILKIILRFRFPVHIITKSNIILRDTDILKKINDVGMLPDDVANDLKSKTLISFSFSTTDNKIAKIFEPNAPTPSERLKTIKVLSKEGFNVGVAFMPILPYISDSKKELKKSISLFSKNNVNYILPGSMSLFGSSNHSSRIKYYKLLEKHFPEILDKTKALFSNREYPSRSYQNNIYKKVAMVSEEFKIKNSII